MCKLAAHCSHFPTSQRLFFFRLTQDQPKKLELFVTQLKITESLNIYVTAESMGARTAAQCGISLPVLEMFDRPLWRFSNDLRQEAIR